MAAVPSTGRADTAQTTAPPEAEATRDLYERYSRQIYGYCLSALGSPEEADDAVQSTFLNVFRSLQRGIVPKQEAAWLYRIARNVCLTRRRSSRRRGRVESPVDFALVEAVAPAQDREAAPELLGVRDALEHMPEMQRRAILLREWQGLSYREIAEDLGVTQPAVETLIFRARRGLADRLERPSGERSRFRSTRLRAGGDLGGLLTTLKTMLAGGAAAKVAGAAAVVAVSTVAVAVSDHGPRPHSHPTPTVPARHVAPRPARVAATSAPVRPVSAGAPVVTVSRPAAPKHPNVASHGAARQESRAVGRKAKTAGREGRQAQPDRATVKPRSTPHPTRGEHGAAAGGRVAKKPARAGRGVGRPASQGSSQGKAKKPEVALQACASGSCARTHGASQAASRRTSAGSRPPSASTGPRSRSSHPPTEQPTASSDSGAPSRSRATGRSSASH
jgi:RNA polymerase sigma factor (sigma-70 family)